MTKGYRKYVLSFFCWICAWHISAQDVACFYFLSDSVGCIPFTVRVRSCAQGNATVAFNFTWRPNPNPFDYITIPNNITDTAYTYTVPGTYIIEQLRGGNIFQRRTVQVFDSASRPRFFLNSCNDSLIIRFQDPVFNKFNIQVNAAPPINVIEQGNFFSLGRRISIAGEQQKFQVTVTGLSPPTCKSIPVVKEYVLYKELPEPKVDSLMMLPDSAAQLYFYAKQSVDYQIYVTEGGVQIFTDSVRAAISDVPIFSYPLPRSIILAPNTLVGLQTFDVCKIKKMTHPLAPMFCSAQPGNRQIALKWNKYQGDAFSKYVLYRNGELIFQTSQINDTTLLDTMGLVCGINYCYVVKAEVLDINAATPRVMRSIAATVCANASSDAKPPSIINAFINIEGNKVRLEWEAPPAGLAGRYSIFRKDDADNYTIIGTSTSPVWVDTVTNAGEPCCYKIQYNDICDNTSDLSNTFCSIHLTATKGVLPTKNLKWTPYTGWKEGVEQYEVEYLDLNEQAYKTVKPTGQLTHTDGVRDTLYQILRYRVVAWPKAAELAGRRVQSNVATLDQEIWLVFPQVFTPNGDNVNDEFRAYGMRMSGYKLTIFNRWGEQVFATSNIREGWDGRYNNRDAPEGVYVYIATAEDESGKRIQLKGTFQLLR